MIPIEEYIQKTQQERQAHLRLDEPCIERGGMSSYFKGLLAHILNTTIPAGRKIHVCHACHNGLCSNPNHLYWGTASENVKDAIANGKPCSPYHAVVAKHGVEEANRRQQRSGNQNGKGNLGKSKSEDHKANLSKAGTDNPNHGRSGGRKPATDPTELKRLVQTHGFNQAAKILGISIEALRGRFYRLGN